MACRRSPRGLTELIKNVTYNARGQRETQEYGNLLWSRWTYHPTTFRVETRKTGTQGPFGPGQATLDERYTYNGIGNLTEKRLGETSIVDYVYGDPLHASAVTATPQEGRAYTYDLNGDMTTHRAPTRPLTWTRDYRLATLEVPGGSTASFAYDADGLRVRKTWLAGTATVTRYPFPGYEVASDGTVTQFLRMNGELVAARRSTGQTYYYHTRTTWAGCT